MVFHSLDKMSSLALHLCPKVALWNLRWNTMPHEAKLPAEERRFTDLDTTFAVDKFFFAPVGCYLAWLAAYWLLMFVLAKKRITQRNYDTLYAYYTRQPWAANHLLGKHRRWATAIFLACHVTFFFACHLLSFLSFYSEIWATGSTLLYLTWSIWNASCFYMEYFAKKYQASLDKLDEVQKQLDKEE